MVKPEAGLVMTSSYTLTADMPGFKIRQVSPSVVGNSGSVTLQIEAGDLSRWTQVMLIDEAQNVIEADEIYFGERTQLHATFDLTGVVTGTYDMRILSQEDTAEYDPDLQEVVIVVHVNGDHVFTDAIDVISDPQTGLTTSLLLPGSARLGRIFPFQIEIVNDSINDLPSPIVLVRSSNDTPLSFSPAVGPDDLTEVQLMPISQIGHPAALSPGERFVVQLYGYASMLPASEISIQELNGAGLPLDWAPYEAVYRDNTSLPVWQQTWSNFQGIVGSTWDQYQEALRLAAAEQSIGERPQFIQVELLIDDLLARAEQGQSDLSGFIPFPTGMDDALDLPENGPLSSRTPYLTHISGFLKDDPHAADFCEQYRPRPFEMLVDFEIFANVILIPYLFVIQSPSTAALYSEFTTNGSPQYLLIPESDTVVQGDGSIKGFKNSEDTESVVKNILRHAAIKLKTRLSAKDPAFGVSRFPADQPVWIPIEELLPKAIFDSTNEGNGSPRFADNLRWNLGLREIPGALAGGVGETDSATGHSQGSDIYGNDARNIDGYIVVTRRTNDAGKTIYFDLRTDLVIDVKDTLDFCPGNLASGLTWIALIQLATLEANGWADDVGFETQFSPIVARGVLPAFKDMPDEFDPEPRPGPGCDPGGTGSGPDCTGDFQFVTSLFSSDPNDIVGPAGVGDGNWIRPEEPLPYIIHFENDPDVATAPAQEVFITNQLDPDMDWTTLELVSMGFGPFDIQLPPGRQSFGTFIDWTNEDGSPLLVELEAHFDSNTGELSWSFRSLDPDTGLLPLDPLAGFLPVNDPDLHNGEGFVTYLIQQQENLPSGTEITNQANIVFDINDPIVTNVALNSIDADPPTSSVDPLPESSPVQFTVSWSGADQNGSGVASYDVYVSEDGGSFTVWQQGITTTSAIYTGVDGHTYGFFSVATDLVGFVQATPGAAQATTNVVGTKSVFIPLLYKV